MLNLKTFHESLNEICPDFQKVKFLLAISGGVDSMVLMNLFRVSSFEFQVAHVNYHFRGEDSDLDQKLVENFCKNHDIQFHLKDISEQEKLGMKSLQNWARNLRYDFFRKIQKEENINFIVTAHHLNDQLETFIINLSKASGIKGLTGIPSNENEILRPLLAFTKEEIYHFAKENQIEYREDLSNKKSEYLRNKIRNEIMPKLLETNENFLENFGKSLSYLRETKDFVKDTISEIEKEIITEKGDCITIKKSKFFTETNFVQFEILQKFGFNSVVEILKIKNAETGRIFISRKFNLIIDRENLILKKIINQAENKRNEEILLEINSKNEIIVPKTIQKEILEIGKLHWEIDLDKIRMPLVLRRKKEGDLFYPMGMIGKKKLSKFFKDEKLSIFEQEKIWILCDANYEILGILNYRQDRRFIRKKGNNYLTLML